MKRIFYVTLVVLMLGLAGCTSYDYSPPAEEAQFSPGTYVVGAEGHNGPISAAVTLDASRVTKIEVLSHEESPGLGDTAMQTIADAVLAKQGFDVDVVSGATYSSVAVLEAVSRAMDLAGADVEIITMESLGLVAQAGDFPAPPYTPGKYTASAQGFGGEVTVEVELSADGILSVTAEGKKETSGIGGLAIDELPAAIVAAGTTEVDAISGATITSDAIRAAVVDAVTQAKP